MDSTKAKARIAGILYLAMSIPGWFTLAYIPSRFIVRGDATTTASNIASGAFIYRLGILSDLVSETIFIFLVLLLYDLLKDVDRKQARLMVVLVVISVAFEFLNTLNLFAPLILLSGADFLTAFTKSQLDALVMLFLRLRGNGFGVIELFWGLWLLPFGILVFKSGFFPRILGVLLMVACVAYIVDCFSFILFPDQSDGVSKVALKLTAIGELAIMGWLIVNGATLSGAIENRRIS